MSNRMKDKVVIVSGAGASGPGWGNGKAAAALYAREGAKVFAVESVRLITAQGGCARKSPSSAEHTRFPAT